MSRSILLSVLLAACGGADTHAPEAAPAPEAPPAPAEAPAAEAPAPEALKVGDPAPAIDLKLHDGTVVSLASLSGKQVLLYFYPKDDTPGCTVEAIGLRDGWADIQAAGLVVYGVSLQDAASHQAFIDKHQLPFPLVVDTDGAVAGAFRVPVRGEYASRQSFLVGADGKIKAVWLDVDPQSHAADILAAAKAI